ncbi:MAG: transglutaminase family protein [Candidatus Methylophosphatis roskildensis]
MSAPPCEEADFDAAVRAHDQALAKGGFDIWVGAEPTFTDRFSDHVQWISAALGDDKLVRAERLLLRLASETPGAALMRSVGRRYPGEDMPRWSLGLLACRDGSAIWNGPPDPLLVTSNLPPPDLAQFQAGILTAAKAHGFEAEPVESTGDDDLRLLLHERQTPAPGVHDVRLTRPSCHDELAAESGLHDELSDEGLYLFVLRGQVTPVGEVLRLELPALGDVSRLRRVLALIAAAAQSAQLPTLILAGYPPPVDADIAWTTITPDPAVIEINSAPFPDCARLLRFSRGLFAAAAIERLAPYRLHFNGEVGDSGGAGQITLGGPAPLGSPFFVYPNTLPGWIRYVNHHPALSYFFAHDYIGAFGQSVRIDERDREHFDELGLALHLLAAEDRPEPELIWRALSPFLADISGNTHRADLNVEKLWNPYLPNRGQLGLLEFRGLRMADSPERLVSVAALLRAVTARLAVVPFDEELTHWGAQLHDRFALPFCLRQDLRAIFEDLEQAGVGLAAALRNVLLDDEYRVLGRVAFDTVELTVKRALEFWPLVGDAATQDQGTSRLVDASTARVELCVQPLPGHADRDFDGWAIATEGGELPLRCTSDETRPARLFGLRYRRFVPSIGLHPTLPAHGPITLLLWHPRRRNACRITLHEWRPDQKAYDGLPEDAMAARARRRARIVAENVPPPDPAPPPAPAHALTPWCLDLRRL